MAIEIKNRAEEALLGQAKSEKNYEKIKQATLD